MPRLILLLLPLLAFAACGGDSGGSAPTAPTAPPPPLPPPRPLSWTDVPESETIKVREQKEISLSLSAAVTATYTHSASNANVTIAGESPRNGIYRLQITGVEAGETIITVTAMAGGYETATATFPLMVELRTLEWSSLPDEIEVEVGEQETARLQLNSLVLPELQIEPSNDNVAVSAECAIGGCELTVVGLAGGESVITVTATADGYTDATGEIDVIVEDPFDLSLWRELVFDAFGCPNGFSDERCRSRWGERNVEARITAVLPFQPDFHIVTPLGDWRFTRQHIDTIEDAIRDSVEQLTGRKFAGRITIGDDLKDLYGWVDVVALGDEFWEERGASAPCGAAAVGATEGLTLINVDRLDDCSLLPLAMHEIGHALGFYHVLDVGDYLMSPFLTQIPPSFTQDEQFHARLAYEWGRGAPYTPDPRGMFATSHMTTEAFSTGRAMRVEDIPLGEMIQCPLH